jgi:methyl-accepting chemotaxis protein
MKRHIKITTITTTILCLGMIFTSGIMANSTLEERIPDLNYHKEQIQTLINDRTSVMVSDNNVELRQINTSNQLFEKENQIRSLITDYRENLKKMNETYKEVRTQIDLLGSKILEDGKLSIKLKKQLI